MKLREVLFEIQYLRSITNKVYLIDYITEQLSCETHILELLSIVEQISIEQAKQMLENHKNRISIGQRYKSSGRKYLLSRVNDKTVSLICLKTGNMYRRPVEVINLQSITKTEFDKICGSGQFTRI